VNRERTGAALRGGKSEWIKWETLREMAGPALSGALGLVFSGIPMLGNLYPFGIAWLTAVSSQRWAVAALMGCLLGTLGEAYPLAYASVYLTLFGGRYLIGRYLEEDPSGTRPAAAAGQAFWQRVKEAVNLPDLDARQLRHTYATMNAAAGVEMKTLGACMGHSTISTTADIYTQDEPTRLNHIRNVLTDSIFNCWIFCAVQRPNDEKRGMFVYIAQISLLYQTIIQIKRAVRTPDLVFDPTLACSLNMQFT